MISPSSLKKRAVSVGIDTSISFGIALRTAIFSFTTKSLRMNLKRRAWKELKYCGGGGRSGRGGEQRD